MESRVDEITVRISQNIQVLRHRQGFSVTALARKSACNANTLRRSIEIGYQDHPQCTKWDVAVLLRVAGALGVRIEDLTKDSVPHRPREWNPFHDNPNILLETFEENEKCVEEFVTWDRLFACPKMIKEVQNKVHLDLFGPMAGTKEGVKIVEASNDWGDTRRARYLSMSKEDIPKTTTIMLRSDLERLIYLKPPYSLCRLEEAAMNLEYIRQKCVIDRGFEILLLEDSELQKHYDLFLELEPLVALGVFGKRFGYRKLKGDHRLILYERADDVASCWMTLKRLKQLAESRFGVSRILSELDQYQRTVESQLKDLGRSAC